VKDPYRVRMVRAGSPPKIDGRLDEAEWSKATVINGFKQAEPNEGTQPSEKTIVRLLYDADFVYISVRALDSKPNGIIAKERQRDIDLDGDDSIALAFDPFHDRQRGYYFQVNPLGARRDGLITQEREAGSYELAYSVEWDGIWYAEANIDAQGWAVEIAIPIKTISFDPGSASWGFNVERRIARKNEVVRWRAAQRVKRVYSMGDAGELVGLTGLRQGLGLDLIPYAKVKLTHDSEKHSERAEIEPGLDLFYKPTPSVTLALTLNTDFAEAEVDDRRVNLTRFPLFFPEKRAFFLQDANYFRFGGIQTSPLPFFSRKIGLSNEGEPIDLLGGIKATGRMGRLNFGLLDVQMDDFMDLGSKNLAVGRAGLDVGQESSAGLIFTHGDPLSDQANYVTGGDFNFRESDLFGQGELLEASFYAMRSDTEGTAGHAFGTRIFYPNFTWDAALIFDQIGEDFNPALGFIDQPGIRSYESWVGRRWRLKAVDNFYVQLYGRMRTDLDNRVIDREVWLPYLILETNARDEFFFAPIFWQEQFFEPFEIVDGVIVPPGDYHYTRYFLAFKSKGTRLLSGNVELFLGDYLNGTRTDFEGELVWRPTPLFNAATSYEVNDASLPFGDFTVHTAQLNLNFAFTPRLAWNIVGQYDNISSEFGLNSRMRYTVEPGTDMYLVFNQGVDTSDGRFQPLRSDLSLKLAWTFRF